MYSTLLSCTFSLISEQVQEEGFSSSVETNNIHNDHMTSYLREGFQSLLVYGKFATRTIYQTLWFLPWLQHICQ